MYGMFGVELLAVKIIGGEIWCVIRRLSSDTDELTR